MDVCGRQPTAEAGECFRANVWAWRPIHDLIGRLCSDLLDPATFAALGYNDGAGPTGPETCRAMADRFEAWLADHPDGHTVDLGMWQTADGRLLMGAELDGRSRDGLLSAYRIDAELLREWIEFLRHCGGFEVW